MSGPVVRKVWLFLVAAFGLTCLAVYSWSRRTRRPLPFHMSTAEIPTVLKGTLPAYQLNSSLAVYNWERTSGHPPTDMGTAEISTIGAVRKGMGTILHHQLSSSSPAPSHPRQHVKWTRYRDPKTGKSHPLQGDKFHDNSNKNQQPLLETVPRSFQEKLLSGLPLLSYPGPEGLFRPRYDRFLKTLLDYTNNHSKMRSSPSSRILTWQCTTQEHCGGLGDRVKGVTYALLLAIFSHRRLVVFWEDSLDGFYVDPHMINWRDDGIYDFLRRGVKTDSQVQHISIKSVLGQQRRPTNNIGKDRTEHYMKLIGSNSIHIVLTSNLEPSSLMDSERSGNQEWIRSGLKWSGLSHLSPSELDDVVGVVFRYLFRLKSYVLVEMQVARHVLGLYSPYAALHLRAGFAGMPNEEFGHPKLEKSMPRWYLSLRCAVASADRFLGKDSLLFLATDSNRVKDIAVAKYGQRIHTLGNSLVHVDKFDRKKVDAKVKEGALVVWVEFLLLAQSKVLIKGASGYSWIAGLISGMDGNRTVNTNKCGAH